MKNTLSPENAFFYITQKAGYNVIIDVLHNDLNEALEYLQRSLYFNEQTGKLEKYKTQNLGESLANIFIKHNDLYNKTGSFLEIVYKEGDLEAEKFLCVYYEKHPKEWENDIKRSSFESFIKHYPKLLEIPMLAEIYNKHCLAFKKGF